MRCYAYIDPTSFRTSTGTEPSQLTRNLEFRMINAIPMVTVISLNFAATPNDPRTYCSILRSLSGPCDSVYCYGQFLLTTLCPTILCGVNTTFLRPRKSNKLQVCKLLFLFYIGILCQRQFDELVRQRRGKGNTIEHDFILVRVTVATLFFPR